MRPIFAAIIAFAAAFLLGTLGLALPGHGHPGLGWLALGASVLLYLLAIALLLLALVRLVKQIISSRAL